jgi:hypothetical protein
VAFAHPFVTFRGVQAHLEVQATLSHGIAPMQVMIRVPPTFGIEEGGTLIFRYGNVVIPFFNCKVDRIDAAKNADGLMVWTLTILDRRWKWKECGQVSGYYNVREGENTSSFAGIPRQVKKGTEKNLKQLMALCLDAMGERGYDLSRVPTDQFPEVEWDFDLPAEALAKLADKQQFRIVFNWARDRVEIWPDGEGQLLTTQRTQEYQITADPPERPDQLVFVGSRALWELDLPLEPVARDANGNYWPLNSRRIPYLPDVTPINGNYFWQTDLTFFNAIFDTPVTGVDGVYTYRDLARADVFRKYRITPGFRVPGPSRADSMIDSIDRILPLLDTRLTTQTIGETTKPKPPTVWGIWSRDEATPDVWRQISDPSSKLDARGNPPDRLTIKDGWSVDTKTGILTFDRPRVQWGFLADGEFEVAGNPVRAIARFPAQLFLRTGFGVRQTGTRAWLHQTLVRRSQQKRFGTMPRYVKGDDAIYRIIGTRNGPQNNINEYAQAAAHYLNAEELKYQPRDPASATYAGWLPWIPDGAIQQITWSLTGTGAVTRVSRNREEPVLGLSYDEQRLYQQLRGKLAAPDTSRADADKRDRRVA